MKTFLLLSVFAMASAGIYGFADMSNDIAKGKMIDYKQIETEHARQTRLENERLEKARVLAKQTWSPAAKLIKPVSKKAQEFEMKQAVASKPKKKHSPVKIEPKIRFHHFSRGGFEEERTPEVEQQAGVPVADSLAPKTP